MKIATKHLQLLEQTRKQLHSQPELSGKEFNTQQKIIDFLETPANKGKSKSLNNSNWFKIS